MSLTVFLPLFFYFSFCATAETSLTKFSPDLQALLNLVRSKCTIEVYFKQDHPAFVHHFEVLVSHIADSKQYYPTFSLNNIRIDTSLSKILPRWKFQKFSVCSAQLHYFDSYETLETILLSFVITVFEQVNPRFVLLWDTSSTATNNWSELLAYPEFYMSLTDYRIYIGRDSPQMDYSGHLICIPCGKNKQSRKIQDYMIPISGHTITENSIQIAWKKLHRSNFKLPVQFKCKQTLYWCAREKLANLIATELNTTISYRRGSIYKSYSHMLDTAPLDTDTGKMFLATTWPRLIMVASSVTQTDIVIITMVPKYLLRRDGLTSLISCFEANVWYSFVIQLAVVVLILRIFTRGPNGIREKIWLWTFGPMTDHWNSIEGNSFVSNVVILWSTLCLSMTILYGGELATAMSVMKPPVCPKSLLELSANLVALNGLFRPDGTFISYVANELNERAIAIMSSPKKIRSNNYNRMILDANRTMADRLTRNVCGSFETFFATVSPQRPFECYTQDLDIHHEKPLSFLTSERNSNFLQWAFRSNNDFWVSQRSPLPLFRKTHPVMFLKNFFAKLAEPIVTSWWAHGLEVQASRMFTDVTLQDMQGRKYSFPRSNKATSNAGEQSAETLASIGSVAQIFYILIGSSLLLLLIECSLK